VVLCHLLSLISPLVAFVGVLPGLPGVFHNVGRLSDQELRSLHESMVIRLSAPLVRVFIGSSTLSAQVLERRESYSKV